MLIEIYSQPLNWHADSVDTKAFGRIICGGTSRIATVEMHRDSRITLVWRRIGQKKKGMKFTHNRFVGCSSRFGACRGVRVSGDGKGALGSDDLAVEYEF